MRLRPRWRGAAEEAIGALPDDYGVVTVHWPRDVDDPAGLAEITHALRAVGERLPLIFAVHPRTRAHLNGAADLACASWPHWDTSAFSISSSAPVWC